MCRQNHLWGWMLICFGAGLLLGFWLESGFFTCCLGLGALALGVLVMSKNR
ncbi:MAG TPA: hypothetical protein IAC31_09345 [Candidatus Faecousia intestinigallinarum]|nr:hypothetical protein [Candidatus Faecousia intestinigallinarum]